MDSRKFISLVLGWLYEGRTEEQRAELDAAFGDSTDSNLDTKIAESYAADGADELWVDMMQEMRHAKSPEDRARIKSKYAELSRKRKAD